MPHDTENRDRPAFGTSDACIVKSDNHGGIHQMTAPRIATHRGTLPIGNETIQCFVLDDKTRVISGRSMTKSIGMKGRGQGIERIVKHPTLRPFLDEELITAITEPLQYLPSKSSKTPIAGYEAPVLLKVAEAILNARDAKALKTEQELRYALHADLLIRAFAAVGIIALVDEATGYQEERDRDELSQILAAYIAPELIPWTKKFPDEFYRQLFRLRGWTYKPLSVARPKAVGKFTAQLVYDQLPKGVVEELRRRNPVIDQEGNRAHRHHQLLTVGLGDRHLEMHLAQVITLMRISPNWESFMRNFRRAFPGENGVQDELEFDFDE